MYVEQWQKALERKDASGAKIMIKSLANNLRAIGRVNETNTQFLTQEQINSFQPLLKATLDLVTEQKEAFKTILTVQQASREMDEEDVEKFKEQIAKIGRAASQCMELTGQLVEKFKDVAKPVVESSSRDYWQALL